MWGPTRAQVATKLEDFERGPMAAVSPNDFAHIKNNAQAQEAPKCKSIELKNQNQGMQGRERDGNDQNANKQREGQRQSELGCQGAGAANE